MMYATKILYYVHPSNQGNKHYIEAHLSDCYHH